MQEKAEKPVRPAVRPHAPAGNLATGWLKVIALAFMFMDHAGKMLCRNMLEMRLLGRIAFPLYLWCMVVGFHYTRSVWKYILRVAAVGLLSQPLYNLALNHTWKELNVFFTLALGLCALWGLREKKWGSHIWAPLAALALASVLNTDYGWKGVLLLMLLNAVRESRQGIAAVMIAYGLFWGFTTQQVRMVFGLDLRPLLEAPVLKDILPTFMRLQTMCVAALPLMLVRIPRKLDLKMPTWLGYTIYPAHLAVLYLLEKVL